MKEALNYRGRGSSSMEEESCGHGGAGSFSFFDALEISLIQSRKKRSTLREEGPAVGGCALLIVPEEGRNLSGTGLLVSSIGPRLLGPFARLIRSAGFVSQAVR
jgi:hypothetical protein